MTSHKLKIALVTEPLADRSLRAVMDWLAAEVPEISGLEIGTGAYAPTGHCDMPGLLADPAARRTWQNEIAIRGFEIAAFNCWGNPLHPQFRALPGLMTRRCAIPSGLPARSASTGSWLLPAPAGSASDVTPHFAGGGWLPYLEHVYQHQWTHQVHDYWAAIGEFAIRTDPALLICLELHPGTVAYNVETFERLAALSPPLPRTSIPVISCGCRWTPTVSCNGLPDASAMPMART